MAEQLEKDMGMDKVKAEDVYSKYQLLNFPCCVAQLCMELVGRGFVLTRIRTMDSMATIECVVPKMRNVSFHVHPDHRISYIHSFHHIDMDPNQTDDQYHEWACAAWLDDLGYWVDKELLKPKQ